MVDPRSVSSEVSDSTARPVAGSRLGTVSRTIEAGEAVTSTIETHPADRGPAGPPEVAS